MSKSEYKTIARYVQDRRIAVMNRSDWDKDFAKWGDRNAVWDYSTALELAEESDDLFERYPDSPETAASETKNNCEA